MDYFEQRTAENIGVAVDTPDGPGVIVSGDFSTGQWDVRLDSGDVRTYEGPQMHERDT